MKAELKFRKRGRNIAEPSMPPCRFFFLICIYFYFLNFFLSQSHLNLREFFYPKCLDLFKKKSSSTDPRPLFANRLEIAAGRE